MGSFQLQLTGGHWDNGKGPIIFGSGYLGGKYMSGGGGGGSSRDEWRPGVQDGGVGEDECDISELTILSSPNPKVVSTLTENVVLTIELVGQDLQRLVAKTEDGDVAGAITSKEMPNIAECIRAGFHYEAKVLSVDGGRVEVMVQRR